MTFRPEREWLHEVAGPKEWYGTRDTRGRVQLQTVNYKGPHRKRTETGAGWGFRLEKIVE